MKHLQSLHRDTWVDRLNQISNQIQIPSPATFCELLVSESVEGKHKNLCSLHVRRKQAVGKISG